MKPIVNIQGDGVAVILIPHLERRVHVFAAQSAAREFVGITDGSDGNQHDAVTFFDNCERCRIGMWFDTFDAGVLAHECLHAVNIIHDYVGFRSDRRNDEMDAYLLGYLVNGTQCALKMLEKQKGKR